MSENKEEIKYTIVDRDPISFSEEQLNSLNTVQEVKTFARMPITYIGKKTIGKYVFRIRPFLKDGIAQYSRKIYVGKIPADSNNSLEWVIGTDETKNLCKEAKDGGYDDIYMYAPSGYFMVLVHMYSCPESQRDYVKPGQDVVLMLKRKQWDALDGAITTLREHGMFADRLDETKACPPFVMDIKMDPNDPRKNLMAVHVDHTPLSGEIFEIPPLALPEGVEWKGNLDNVCVEPDRTPTEDQVARLRNHIQAKLEQIRTRSLSIVQNSVEAPAEVQGHTPQVAPVLQQQPAQVITSTPVEGLSEAPRGDDRQS